MRNPERTSALRLAGVALSLASAALPALASAQVWPNVPTTRVRNFNNLSGIVINDTCANPDDPECEGLLDVYGASNAPLPPVVPGSPYPSQIEVPAASFVAGSTITDVNVRIRGVSHDFLDDVDILLVGPQGQYVMLASNVSSAGANVSTEAVDLNWKFDDSARLPLPNSLDNSGRASTRPTVRVNGVDQPNPLYDIIYPEWAGVWTDTAERTFKPSDYDNGGDDDVFPAPAPQGLTTLPVVVTHNATTGIPTVSGGGALSVFNGKTPVGTWSLYVADDFFWYDGAIEGWELEITAKQP